MNVALDRAHLDRVYFRFHLATMTFIGRENNYPRRDDG
jgi:hypothetical protein